MTVLGNFEAIAGVLAEKQRYQKFLDYYIAIVCNFHLGELMTQNTFLLAEMVRTDAELAMMITASY